MAALRLRPCPAAIVAPASSTSGASRLSNFSPRTRARCSLLPLGLGQLNTTLVKMQAPMARPRLRHGHAIRVQKGGADQPFVPDDPDKAAEHKMLMEKLKEMAERARPPDMPFREEIVKMDDFDVSTLTPCDSSFLHIGAKASAIQFWYIANSAMILASDVMVSAGLRLGMPTEISLDTIKRTLSIYVRIFVSAFDDTCQRKTTMETFVSFLDALGGVAAISHILLQDALENLNYNGGSSSNRNLGCDVDRARHEFQQKLNNLKHKFRTAPQFHAYKILIPTLVDAIILADSFVMDMTFCREKVVRQVQGDNGFDSM